MPASSHANTDRAVSPVLGVVLLLAITVLLSATVAGVVLGIGAEPDLPPQVDWAFSYDGENLTIRHDGGDPIDPRSVRLTGGAFEEVRSLEEVQSGRWTVGTEGSIAVQPADGGRDVVLLLQHDDGSGHVLAEFELPTE